MSYCTSCGKKLEGGAFCSYCGAPVKESSEKVAAQGKPVSPSGEIVLGADGKYRWAYELNLYSNFSILYVVLKVLGIGMFAVYLFVMFLEIFDHGFKFDSLLQITLVFLGVGVGFGLLGLVSYYIYSFIMGGKYCVLFVMDEKGVDHIVAPKQMKKSQILATITMLSGVVGRNAGTVGTGMLAWAKTHSLSTFKNVDSVYCYPGRNLIKVNETFCKNQVYCKTEDFAFVKEYIVAHCVNAKNIK